MHIIYIHTYIQYIYIVYKPGTLHVNEIPKCLKIYVSEGKNKNSLIKEN